MVSGNIKSKNPDRLYIRRSDKRDYDGLKSKGSPFKGKENKVLFVMAMITGFRDGSRIPLDKKEGFVRTEYVEGFREGTVIKAIAVAETGDLSVLLDKKEALSIAEQYAAGGIKLLKDRVFSGGYGSYAKKLEESLVIAFGKISEKSTTPHANG